MPFPLFNNHNARKKKTTMKQIIIKRAKFTDIFIKGRSEDPNTACRKVLTIYKIGFPSETVRQNSGRRSME